MVATLLIVLLCGLSAPARGIATTRIPTKAPLAVADFQSWNELDVEIPVTGEFAVAFAAQERFSRALSGTIDRNLEIDGRFFPGDHYDLSISAYGAEFASSGRGFEYKYQPIVAATVWQVYGRWTLSDRSRLLKDFGEVARSWEYRNRPELYWRIGPESTGIAVFTWDEISHYSNYGGWTRNRSAAGLEIPVAADWTTDLYYLRQVDARSQIRVINGVGLTLEWRVR